MLPRTSGPKRQNHPLPAIANVQIVPGYIGVYTLPDGRPEMPGTHALPTMPSKNGTVPVLLPNRFPSIPESGDVLLSHPASNTAASETPAANPQTRKPETQLFRSKA